MVFIKRHTEGDSRVVKEVPSRVQFDLANRDHIRDVKNLVSEFSDLLLLQVAHHDWTKTVEPHATDFYNDLCKTINGEMNFMDGKWAHDHYCVYERHYLLEHCPDDVNLIDDIEMICDHVAAGVARSGEVSNIDIPEDILVKAVKNTTELLKSRAWLMPFDKGEENENKEYKRHLR